MNKEVISSLLTLTHSFSKDIAGREIILVNNKGLPLDEFKTEQEIVDYILKFEEIK